MAVTFDAVGPSSAGTSSSASTSLSWSHTCTGSNLCLIVGVSLGANPDGAFSMSATYNSVAMTSLGTVHSGGATSGFVQAWRLAAPATGANTVAITVTGGTPTSLAGGSVSYTSVDQATPVGTPVLTSSQTGSPSVTVNSTTSGNKVVAVATNGDNFTSSNNTGRWLNNDQGGTGAGMAAGADAAAGGNVTLSWTANADWWAAIGVELLAVAGGGDPVAQPALVSDRGTAANATAATTTSVTLTSPTSIAVGNYLVARVAVDNSGTSGAAPGCTVTDPRSNSWTVLGPALQDPGAAAAGATAYIAYTKVITAYQAADALTFNWGGISTTAKAVVVEEWANIHSASPVAVSAATNQGASTAPSVSITPTAPGQLVYTCLATEGIAGDTFTGDADTTNGSWVSLTRIASANATATNNQCVAGQYKVVTASGAQSWDATITSRDWAALAVVFAPRPSPVPNPRIQRLRPLLVR